MHIFTASTVLFPTVHFQSAFPQCAPPQGFFALCTSRGIFPSVHFHRALVITDDKHSRYFINILVSSTQLYNTTMRTLLISWAQNRFWLWFGFVQYRLVNRAFNSLTKWIWLVSDVLCRCRFNISAQFDLVSGYLLSYILYPIYVVQDLSTVWAGNIHND